VTGLALPDASSRRTGAARFGSRETWRRTMHDLSRRAAKRSQSEALARSIFSAHPDVRTQLECNVRSHAAAHAKGACGIAGSDKNALQRRLRSAGMRHRRMKAQRPTLPTPKHCETGQPCVATMMAGETHRAFECWILEHLACAIKHVHVRCGAER
jgi:hypothetical protein